MGSDGQNYHCGQPILLKNLVYESLVIDRYLRYVIRPGHIVGPHSLIPSYIDISLLDGLHDGCCRSSSLCHVAKIHELWHPRNY